MLAQSSFVHAAVTGRPWYFYLEQSCTVLPFFLVAFLVVLVAAVVTVCSRKRRFDGQVQVNHKHQQSDDVDVLWMALTILGTILLAFVAGLTLLGALGMGYQTRFILPLSPIVAIIVAVFTEELATLKLSSPLTAAWIDQMLSMIMVLTSIHGWYYGVQYPTRYADLHGGVFDILASILRHPTDTEVQQTLFHIPSRAQATLKLLHTHGFLQQHD
jgi:heme/copper-type cytochrome/quinol oxidase subunit 2